MVGKQTLACVKSAGVIRLLSKCDVASVAFKVHLQEAERVEEVCTILSKDNKQKNMEPRMTGR